VQSTAWQISRIKRLGGSVLSEVLVIIGVLDGPSWVGPSQIRGVSYAVDVVLGAAVDGEVGGLVDKRPSLGVGTGGWGGPEGGTEVDPSEYVGIDASIDTRRSAAAVVGEVREIAAADQPEVLPDDIPARSKEGTEPGGVSRPAGRDTRKVRVGVSGNTLGVRRGSSDQRLPGRRAIDEANPLVVETGDGKATREVNLSSVLNGGIDVLDGAIDIDVGEQVRWLDGVLSRAR